MFVNYSICNLIHMELKSVTFILIKTHPLLFYTSKLKSNTVGTHYPNFLKNCITYPEQKLFIQNPFKILIRKPEGKGLLVRY